MRALAVLAVLVLPEFAHAQKPKLELELSAPKEIYPDEVVTMKAVVHNLGKEDAYVMRNVDGAFHGLRNVVDFRYVVKKNGQLVLRRTDVVRIDNLVNTIRPGDLVTVAPGSHQGG